MRVRGMLVAVTMLVLFLAGCGAFAQETPPPTATACPDSAGQLSDAKAAACQSQGAPTDLAPTLTHPAPSATPVKLPTQLIKLPTELIGLPTATMPVVQAPEPTATVPVVQPPEPTTPAPIPTAIVATVAAPTPTVGATKVAGVNQLANPCFDGTHNDDPPGWQQTSGWDVSMNKNPCGPNESAGRINDPTQAGESGPDRDERIWQVVAGQGAYLVAEMQCVHHFAHYTDMNIYGGDSQNGPWQLVWTPFTLADCDKDRWGAAVRHAETQLGLGYAYYKVEFAASYSLVGPDSGGVKFTRAYFESSQ